MQTFTVRELRERSGELSREAEEGRLALVTRHGQPLFVSVPFTQELLEAGVHVALAVSLFKDGKLTSARASRLARMLHHRRELACGHRGRALNHPGVSPGDHRGRHR